MSQKEEAAEGLRLGFLPVEPLSIAILTAWVYLFAYQYQVAYLGYFLLDPVFVEISLSSLLVPTSAVLGLIFLLWQAAIIVPNIVLKYAPYVLLYHHLEIIFSLLALSAYLAGGFTWKSVALGSLALALVFWSIAMLIHGFRNGSGYIQTATKAINSEVDFRRNFLSQRILESDKHQVAITFIALTFVVYVAGDLLGNYNASNRSVFSVVRHSGEDFLIVASRNSGLIGAGVEIARGEEYEASLSRESYYFNDDLLSQVKINTIFGVTVKRPVADRPPRKTFREFINDFNQS